MARHGKDNEYDWLDDPFDEKKAASQAMGGGSKAAIGIGCLVAVVLFVAIIVIGLHGIASIASTM